MRKESIYDLVRGAVPAPCNELPTALLVALAREPCRIARRGRVNSIHLQSGGPKLFQSFVRELSALASTRRAVHDCQHPPIFHNGCTALRSSTLRICSANSARLIFIEAVRGKSFSHTTYPLMRL